MTWVGHVAWTEVMRNAYKILVGKPAGKRPIERPRYRYEVNIRVDIKWNNVWGCGLDSPGSE